MVPTGSAAFSLRLLLSAAPCWCGKGRVGWWLGWNGKRAGQAGVGQESSNGVVVGVG